MVQKAKILYFTVFILVVFAFIFHVTAMGHHHWKKATAKTPTELGLYHTTIGLFTRCESVDSIPAESCYLNKYPGVNTNCTGTACLSTNQNDNCQCDFLPSTKGIASCAIIASVFLGIATIVLFIHSIKTTETRTIGLLLGFLPLLLLLLAFIFILITLILVGSYLSRDIMALLRTNSDQPWGDLLQIAADRYDIRVDWATGLEIIALVFTFISFILYSIFVFKLGRQP